MTMIAQSLAIFLNIGVPQSPCMVAVELHRAIEELTPYRAEKVCPTVRRMTFDAEFGAAAQAAEYFPDTGEIGLSPDLDLNTIIGRSYLLHEMVHAAQFAAGRHTDVACVGQLEAEAYHAQAAYLQREGEPREAGMVLLMGTFAGTCESYP